VCKHVQSANSLRKFTETFKTETNPLSWGGVVSQLGGGLHTPRGGVKILLHTVLTCTYYFTAQRYTIFN